MCFSVVGCGEEVCVGGWAVLFDVEEAFGEQGERFDDLWVSGDRARGCGDTGGVGPTVTVEQDEDEVVGVLVLVAVLKGEDLEHGIGQGVRDARGDAGSAAVVEAFGFYVDGLVVGGDELCAADVESAEPGAD